MGKRKSRESSDGRKRKKSSEGRKSIKINNLLYEAVSREIEAHPEWGIGSVSDFIRRAVDHELTQRANIGDRRTVEFILRGLSSQVDSHDKGQ
jgi:hypothetical protein